MGEYLAAELVRKLKGGRTQSAVNPFAFLNPESPEYIDPESPDYEQRKAAFRERWKAEAEAEAKSGLAPSRSAQQPSAPREMARPVAPDQQPPQPKFQEFAHITGEVLEQFRHVTAADKIIKAEKLAREGGRVQQPQGDAKAIIEAARMARGTTDEDLHLPEKGTLARQIIDAAAKCVNPLHDKVRR